MAKSPKNKSSKLGKMAAIIGAGIIAGSVMVAKREVAPGELVTEVFDGDSLGLENKQAIRLFGIDAPENEYCFGEESKKALTKRVLGKKIILKELRTDKYGRIMAMIYLNGELINEYMVKNGLALHDSDTSKEVKIMNDASDFARINKLGIFSSTCSPEKPPKLGCDIKGHISYDTREKVYLTKDCIVRYNPAKVERFRGEDWFCTEKEALKAGFGKYDCHN